jgi:hypothetical protein
VGIRSGQCRRQGISYQFEDSPCLWDVFNKDYKNKDMKSTAVTKIASSLGVKVDEVKRKMHNPRCQYASELKKTRIKTSGQGANERYVTVALSDEISCYSSSNLFT